MNEYVVIFTTRQSQCANLIEYGNNTVMCFGTPVMTSLEFRVAELLPLPGYQVKHTLKSYCRLLSHIIKANCHNQVCNNEEYLDRPMAD